MLSAFSLRGGRRLNCLLHSQYGLLLLSLFKWSFANLYSICSLLTDFSLLLQNLALVLLNPDIPCLWKQCRSRSVGFWISQLIWSALFAIQYVKLYWKAGSRNLIGWQLEEDVASKFIQHDKDNEKAVLLWTNKKHYPRIIIKYSHLKSTRTPFWFGLRFGVLWPTQHGDGHAESVS